MLRYNIYSDDNNRAVAIEHGTELDVSTRQGHPTICGVAARFLGTVEARSFSALNPSVSALGEGNGMGDYIDTGLPWPHDRAVVSR